MPLNMLSGEFFLIGFYCLCVWAVLAGIFRSYQQQRFSFHLLFSGVYFITFFVGFPFSMGLQSGFGVSLPSVEMLFLTLATATIGYFIYLLSYQFFVRAEARAIEHRHFSSPFEQKRAKLTACFLFLVAILSLGYFIAVNGLLLFRLEKYSQLFSQLVQAVALKRFFYFFLPALLIVYFLSPSRKRWWVFLVAGVLFGGLTYLAVGGTRANLALAVALFVLIGWVQRYLSFVWLVVLGLIAVVAMFFLAKIRYGLAVHGSEAWFTFLYLTRDTFSPWENLARILATDIEFQGLMPIVADFYVYIPKALWADRPDIVWNSANYFTKIVLGNQSGLAISPTLLGSFYIMGGFPLIGLGMALIGGLLQLTDRLFRYGCEHHSAIVQAYCFANLFNVIVLVREGSDAFFSRWIFFSVVFICCWGLAHLLTICLCRKGKQNG